MEFINQTFFSDYSEGKIDTIPYALGIVLALTNGSRILKFINLLISLLRKFIITSKTVIGKFKIENNTSHQNDDIHKEYEEVMKQMREMRVHVTALFDSIHKDNMEWRMSESIRREKKREMKASTAENEVKIHTNDVNICDTSGLETEVCL
uniref:Non-structural glycoprotein 4 n=1 Tax=Rotavirus C (strain RVC/Pig/United States/Cowden/1980) TaxID=10916 RepID=NSP4_ROTPC|nr:RecName: Full=Non-structural glycoprotein 4; Short=NSP4; AltName: Full=NCVP5; AltName: Full=NS28 [Porcine rotavirus C strain Cowden]AAC83712.1 NSP4 [Porcine rotavirus C]